MHPLMRFIFPLLLLTSFSLYADPSTAALKYAGTENLVKDGGFETPTVTGRTLTADGGDPTNNGAGPGWISMKFRQTGTNGIVTAGLTDEMARNGRQSLFVRFNHVNTPLQALTLISNFIPVASGTEYEIGIWGRTDSRDLVTSDGRPAYLKLEVDFFAKDANESVGDPFYRVQPIPGSKGHEDYFTPDGWSLFYTKVPTPPGAVFAQIIWRWETGSGDGEINGIMYFDDASMIGPPPPIPNMTPAPAQDDTSGTQ